MNKIIDALKLAEEALNAMLTHMGMDEDEWTKPTFNQAREALAAIRETLAEPEITTPDVCGEVCARAKLCYGCGKALDEANAKLAEPYACEAGECPDKSLCAGACECLFKAEPMKQEPVAWVDLSEGEIDKLLDDNQEAVGGYVDTHAASLIEDVIALFKSKNAATVSVEAIRAEAYKKGRDDMKEEVVKWIAKSGLVGNRNPQDFASIIRGLK